MTPHPSVDPKPRFKNNLTCWINLKKLQNRIKTV